MSAVHQPRRFGWLPDRPDHRDVAYTPTAAARPAVVDLRAHCPPVYDQGHLGSCTANAIAGALQFDRMKQGLTDFVPSRLFIYYNERVLGNTVASDSGASIRDGIKTVAAQGDCPETEWPYDPAKFADKPPQSCYDQAVAYKAVSYRRVSHDLDDMKSCLAEGYPFVFGISIYWNYPQYSTTGTIPMPGAAAPANQGHTMLAIGYDDRARLFTIRNSHGTEWGLQGYGTIPYEYLTNPSLSQDFWTIQVVL